jgi:protein required for attachment to host cells
MNKLVIPHDAFVFVGDGGKALFLRNEGDEKFPNLKTERVFAEKDPPTREQGTDAPGRAFAGAHTVARSAVEPTDWHEIAKDRFAKQVCAALEDVVRQRAAPAVVIVAPPHILADLRRALHRDVKARVVAEIDKDLTNHPVWEIERHILQSGA